MPKLVDGLGERLLPDSDTWLRTEVQMVGLACVGVVGVDSPAERGTGIGPLPDVCWVKFAAET